MLKDSFIQNVLDGFYTTHEKGDVLIEMDMDAVIAEAITEKENSHTNSSQLDLKDHE